MKSLYAPLLSLCLLLPASVLATTNYYQLTQKELVKLGEAGDIQAMWVLQEPAYYDKKQKKNVVRSPEERLNWVRKGAELGDFRMQATLALHFLPRPMGTGPTTDLAAAEHWLEQVLALPRRAGGTPDAFYHQNIEHLLMWTRQLQRQPAAEAGDADAMFDLAQAHAPQKAFNTTELGNPAQHQHWLAQAADKGHPGAALALAKASRSADEQQKWYRLAADGGNAEALAVMGHQALGRQNASEARQWFAKAAEAGHADAAYRLAGYLKADKDTEGAIDWYRKAAAAGHKDAPGELARLADPTLVRLIAAADQGDGEAAYQLGEHYRQRGDRDRAYKAYYRGMNLGHNEARYQVALLSTTPATQLHLMKIAALEGHAGALAWLERQAGQGAEAARQQQLSQEAERRAFVARIDREGTTDKLEVEIYCQYGGQRCNALRGLAQRAEQSRNQQVEAADRQRIQNIHSDGKTAAQRDAEQRARSECMRRKTESIQRSNTGQQDWRFVGEC